MSKKGSSGAGEAIIEVIFFLCMVAVVVGWVFS